MFEFRAMTMNDIDLILEIEREAFIEPWSRESLIMELENECAKYMVGYNGNGILAYAGMWIILDEAHITNIAVRRDMRKKGMGRELLLRMMDIAIDEKVMRMTLETRVSNIAAQALYQSLGFVVAGVRKAYYTDNKEDALIMWNHDIYHTRGIERNA